MALSPAFGRQPDGWAPRRLLATRSAREFAHGRAILGRAAALGVEIIELTGDRLNLQLPDDPRRAYVEAKATVALVVASPSRRRLQPIAPSADWRVDLAEGCPAHCSYCYLAGPLKGPPITRVYANLDEILDALPAYLGQGRVTSQSAARADEGTTFEASCYTHPLALEPLTGSLSSAITWFGRWQADAQLRFTSSSKAVLDTWYPGSRLDMSQRDRVTKRTKFGSEKQVYDLATMRRLRTFFERRIADILPAARILYWT